MKITIRNANPSEFKEIGVLLISVYSNLEGFPNKDIHPTYYEYLENVGTLSQDTSVELFVAVSDTNKLLGCVLFFHTMELYGSEGNASEQQNACGFRLLTVAPDARELGVGKKLTLYCMNKAETTSNNTLIIHTTNAMKTAWKMYDKLGFNRSEELDFKAGALHVYGFRYPLHRTAEK